MLECNANGLQADIYRLEQKWEELACISAKSYQKLVEAENRLLELREDIDEGILNFIRTGLVFYEALALFAIGKLTRQAMKDDKIPAGKNHSLMGAECVSIAKRLRELHALYCSPELKASHHDDYYKYGLQFFK